MLHDAWDSLADTLTIFARTDDVIEVRVPGINTLVGYFKDKALASKAVQKMDGEANIYFVLNQISESGFQHKRLNEFIQGAPATGDKDIERRKWVLIDCDPERDSGISATDAEKKAGYDLMETVRMFLQKQGFKPPVIADSGNGYHIILRIDLPNDELSRVLIKDFLMALDTMFSNEYAKIDTGVYNAARITKLYGTLAVKGKNTQERPHRRSKLLSCPGVIEISDAGLFQAVIDSVKTREPEQHTKLEEFISKYGIQIKKQKIWEGGPLYELQVCPFNPSHNRGEAALMELKNGALVFKCQHDSCSDNHWEEFKNLYEPEVWEQPTPLEPACILPEFPTECLPDWVKDYVEAVAEDTQTPTDMTAVIALAVLSIPCNKVYRVEGKPGWQEPMNIWSLLVAKPAERKSAVMSHITRPIFEYAAEVNATLRPLIAQNQEALKVLEGELIKLRAVASKNGTETAREAALDKAEEISNFRIMHEVKFTCDDVTPERLSGLLAENGGRMALISAEGGIFGTMDGRYQTMPNLDVFLKSHSGDPVQIDRVGRSSEYIPSPALTMALTVQPSIHQGIMHNDTMKGRGLLARFLYSIPVSRLGNRHIECEMIPRAVWESYNTNLRKMLDVQVLREPHILKLSPEAYRVSVQFATELEPRLVNDLEHIADWAGKLHGAVLRIAGVLHVSIHIGDEPWEYDISAETIKNAISIGQYFTQHALAAYSLMGVDADVEGAKRLLRWLREQKQPKHTKRDILRANRCFKNIAELEPVLWMLCEYGYLREREPVSGGSGRKPSTVYKVNPLFLEEKLQTFDDLIF